MKTRRFPALRHVLGALAAAVVFAGAGPAGATDACDKCDLKALWDDYVSAAGMSAEKAEAAAKLLGDAAGEYQEAIDKAQDLATGLVMPPDPTDPLSWCGQIGDVVGKFQDAMSALSAFANLWQGSQNEAAAKDLMLSAAFYWNQARRDHDCWKKCCEAAKNARPALVTENPDVDFLKAGLTEAQVRECLEKLTAEQLKALRADADAGRLAKFVRPEYVEMMKKLVSKEGTLAH